MVKHDNPFFVQKETDKGRPSGVNMRSKQVKRNNETYKNS